MSGTTSAGAVPMRSLLVRPLQLLASVFSLTLLLALGALALFAWLDFERIQFVRAHVNRTELLEDCQIVLKEAERQLATGSFTGGAEKLARVRGYLGLVPVSGGPVGPVTRERLQQLERLLTQAETSPTPALTDALGVVEQMLERETSIQSRSLDAVYHDIAAERRIALLALLGFPLLLTLMLWVLRQRIFLPIGRLKDFLSRLSEGDFTPVSLARIDPLLLPLFKNYNSMVGRLAQLEQANRDRTLSLEQEVRTATHALLKQQQTLARAERLAAAGEVSATLAHELRNPIAGIHVTLVNLRAELADPLLGERVDLVIAELHRITRLLNGLLQLSRQTPEPPRMVQVDRLVQDLATLMRYQLPALVRLVVQAPTGLICQLPEDGVRQALLNLVMNSVEAMAGSPGTISLEVERRDGRVIFRVLDEGPGFSEEMLAGGVRPFVTSRETGTGLGLAMVKRFARDFGGELAIVNRSPHGACVTLSLSCDGATAAADPGPAAA